MAGIGRKPSLVDARRICQDANAQPQGCRCSESLGVGAHALLTASQQRAHRERQYAGRTDTKPRLQIEGSDRAGARCPLSLLVRIDHETQRDRCRRAKTARCADGNPETGVSAFRRARLPARAGAGRVRHPRHIHTPYTLARTTAGNGIVRPRKVVDRARAPSNLRPLDNRRAPVSSSNPGFLQLLFSPTT